MNQYIHYTAQELAQEASFINYIKGSNQRDITFWSEWISQHPERAAQVEQARKLVRAISFKPISVDPSATSSTKERVWQKISNQTESNTQPVVDKGRVISLQRIWPWIAVAAVGLYFAISSIAISGEDVHVVTTEIAAIKSTELPDKSKITINAESQISYDTQDWQDHRSVQLDGEAFFEVEKGSKFTVVTDLGTVEVLGTSFNVYSRDKKLKVECETGRVKVAFGNDSVILTPGKFVHVVSGKIADEGAGLQYHRSQWRTGAYQYTAATLESVSADLERLFGIDIQLPDESGAKRYTGSFDNDDIEKALAQVYWPMNLTYHRQGTLVTVSQ